MKCLLKDQSGSNYLLRSQYLLSLAIFLVTMGCRKSSSPVPYHFSFNVGTKSYFVDSVKAGRVPAPLHGFGFLGYPNGVDSSNHDVGCFFEIINYLTTDTTVLGTYFCDQNAQTRCACESSISILTMNDANAGKFPIGSNGLFTVVVTENTDEYVSGTFSGLFGGLPISNGSFKVPYKP